MFKQKRINLEQASQGMEIFESIPIRYIQPNFVRVLSISQEANMYAYDAYFIDCALKQNSPLLSLDKKLKKIATKFNIEVLEV